MWTEFAPRLKLLRKWLNWGRRSVRMSSAFGWKEGLALHKIAKVLAGGLSPDRDAQFQRIALLKAEYLDAGNPMFSLDTKAKERLGQLYHQGRVWTQHAFQTFDHDFPSWANGVVIPHGIYDLALHCGHINVGLSPDTSQFACDSLRWYWKRIGQRCYPEATSILLLCDCWREQLSQSVPVQATYKRWSTTWVSRFAWRTIPATVRSTTRSNAVSSRTLVVLVGCAGEADTLDTVVRLMRNASTRTGLKTTVSIIRRIYETGRQVSEDFKASMPILFDDRLPKWNYRAYCLT